MLMVPTMTCFCKRRDAGERTAAGRGNPPIHPPTRRAQSRPCRRRRRQRAEVGGFAQPRVSRLSSTETVNDSIHSQVYMARITMFLVCLPINQPTRWHTVGGGFLPFGLPQNHFKSPVTNSGLHGIAQVEARQIAERLLISSGAP